MIVSAQLSDDAECIWQLMRLHAKTQSGATGPRVLDVTYGYGGFWRGRPDDGATIEGVDIRADELRQDGAYDRLPHGVVSVDRADLTTLPHASSQYDVVTFDPPFLVNAEGSLMAERYTAPKSYADLLRLIELAGAQADRVLQPSGCVIAKVQDWTEGRRRHWLHVDIMNLWDPYLRLDDYMIKVNTTNVRSTSWHTQARTRSVHCFFMVFRPRRRRTRRNRDDGPDMFGNAHALPAASPLVPSRRRS